MHDLGSTISSKACFNVLKFVGEIFNVISVDLVKTANQRAETHWGHKPKIWTDIFFAIKEKNFQMAPNLQ